MRDGGGAGTRKLLPDRLGCRQGAVRAGADGFEIGENVVGRILAFVRRRLLFGGVQGLGELRFGVRQVLGPGEIIEGQALPDVVFQIFDVLPGRQLGDALECQAPRAGEDSGERLLREQIDVVEFLVEQTSFGQIFGEIQGGLCFVVELLVVEPGSRPAR